MAFYKKKSKYLKQQENEPLRVRLAKGREVIGIVETRLGYGKSRIRCTDGKVRLCRVPGALKRRLWVRPDDYVIVEPWEAEGDKKGNIVYKYKKNQVAWLRKQDYLKNLIESEEF